MEIENTRLTSLEERKEQYSEKKNAWNDLYTRLSTLLSKLTDLKLSSTFTSMTVNSSDSNALTANAKSGTASGTYRIGIIQLAQAHRMASVSQVAADDGAALGLEGTFSITVNGETRSITVNATDSLSDIMDLINAIPEDGQTDSGAGDVVSASIIDHRLVLTSKTSGEEGEISFEDPDNVLQGLQLVSDTSGTIIPDAVVQEAQDAVFTVDGLTITRTTNTVTDVIQGVTLNLLGVTDTNGNGAIEPAETLRLEISQDIQTTIDAVNAVVEQYNTVMDFISTALGDEGDLQGDTTLARIQSYLRQLMTDRITGLTGSYQTPWSIGLSTGAVAGSGTLTFDSSGKITVDTETLAAALEDDPAAVMAVFTNDGGTGLVDRLAEYITSLVRSGDGLIPFREQSLQKIMDDLDDQIERMEERLTLKEEQLREQFAAMEEALATLQSQGDWLASLIDGWGN